MSEVRLIKKYANRRLYDATQSRHITLEDIRALIVGGQCVKVIEDKTGEDITRVILLQVIADQEQFGRPILSTPLLEALIRFYGNSLQSFLSTYLEKSVETFMHQQEVVQTHLTKLMSTTPLASMSELTRHNMELWAHMQESLFGAVNNRDGAASRDGRNGNGTNGSAPEHDEPRA